MAKNPKPVRKLECRIIVSHCRRLGLNRRRERHGLRSLRAQKAMSGQYILKGGFPVKAPNLLVWALWFENSQNRIVEHTTLLDGEVEVSTIFLGLDHGWTWGEPGTPVLYETIIFGGDHSNYQERYCTRRQAKEGHKKAIELVFTVLA